MAQLMFADMEESFGQIGHFTIALYSLPERPIYSGWSWRRKRERPDADAKGLCLVFGPPFDRKEYDTDHPMDHLHRVMDARFLKRWAIQQGVCQLWFVQVGDAIAVSDLPREVPLMSRYGNTQEGFGILRLDERGEWEKRTWSYAELHDMCFNIEKLASNCQHCDDRDICFIACIETWAAETGKPGITWKIRDSESGGLFADVDVEEKDEVAELMKRLEKFTAKSAWQFISPLHCIDEAFSPRLLEIDELNFDLKTIEDNRKTRSERSQNAAATRRALKRCKNECWYNTLCVLNERPYYGRPAKCQEGRAYNSFSHGGPYTERQMYAAAQDFWENLKADNPNVFSPEQIAYIAYNAGRSTWIYGCEYTLGRMTEKMDMVEFYNPTQRKPNLYVTFDDARLLCTTPYYHRGSYEYPGRYRTQYNRSGYSYGRVRRNTGTWHEPPKMPPELFYAYLEVCQHTWIRNRGYTRPSQIKILSVEWDGDRHLRSETNYGYPLSFNDMRDIMQYDGGFPSIVQRTILSREEAEKLPPVTTPGTQS